MFYSLRAKIRIGMIMILGEHNWNTLEVTETIQTLGSDFGGLSKAEAKGRLAQFRLNGLHEKKRYHLRQHQQ